MSNLLRAFEYCFAPVNAPMLLRSQIRQAAVDFLLPAVIAASRIHFLPKNIDVVSFVPFCALVGGFGGAFRHILLHGFDDFPKQESFRGAFLGVLFGFMVIFFGLVSD